MAAKKRTPKNAAPKGEKTAPTKAAKKAAPNGKQSSKKNGALLKAAKEILPRLRAGETTLGAERKRLGHKYNTALRKALTELLGSKAAYTEMMAAAKKKSTAKKA